MHRNTTETQGTQGSINSHVLGIFLISYYSNVVETHNDSCPNSELQLEFA